MDAGDPAVMEATSAAAVAEVDPSIHAERIVTPGTEAGRSPAAREQARPQAGGGPVVKAEVETSAPADPAPQRPAAPPPPPPLAVAPPRAHRLQSAEVESATPTAGAEPAPGQGTTVAAVAAAADRGAMARGVATVANTAAGDVAPEAQAPADLPAPDMEALAVRTARWQRVGVLGQQQSVRVRLSPPELGSVQIALRTSNNIVRVQMTVESEAVRQLLQAHSQRLIEGLGAHGMQADRIEVVVEASPGQMGEQGDEQAPAGDGQRQGFQRRQGRQEAFGQQLRDEMDVTA